MHIDKPTTFTSALRAIVLTADKFEDMELFFPYMRLMEAGIRVDVAAPRVEKLTGENGYWFENVDLPIDEVNANDYDILVIPGGQPGAAPTTVANHPHAQEITKQFFAANKPVGAICHGPYTLVSAHCVRGRKLTGYWGDGVPEQIIAAGGLYQDTPVVSDGNLVTARWPADLPFFMREFMALIARS